MVILLPPSKFAEPLITPVILIFLAVANFEAVDALPIKLASNEALVVPSCFLK
jgi:hypothetical protein